MVQPETTSSPERQTEEKINQRVKKTGRLLFGKKHYQSTGRVEVTYICTQANQILELEECKYLPLPQSVRKEIQEKFAHGITLERIMDGV